jgi:hypothetical protein
MSSISSRKRSVALSRVTTDSESSVGDYMLTLVNNENNEQVESSDSDRF